MSNMIDIGNNKIKKFFMIDKKSIGAICRSDMVNSGGAIPSAADPNCDGMFPDHPSG